LRFTTKDARSGWVDGTTTPQSEASVVRPPLSPSAAPSPHPEKDLLAGLNPNQLALLNKLKFQTDKKGAVRKRLKNAHVAEVEPRKVFPGEEDGPNDLSSPSRPSKNEEDDDAKSNDVSKDLTDDEDDMMLHSEDPVEARLREITELLISDRQKRRSVRDSGEKRQVIFVVANYFVLFLAIVAISAEIQARAPNWLNMMEEQLQNVQDCSANQEALFECVSRGDFAGIAAAVILWLSRSVATRRIFLFGFDTPKKLWTVVYESLVTSVCWGFSYLFIRRGMNPDTRSRFVQKYWKDAVYGSLAGFFAAFMKQILKNLIPQEVVEDAFRERQLKILSWLPSFA
jgi:hypothetical protein